MILTFGVRGAHFHRTSCIKVFKWYRSWYRCRKPIFLSFRFSFHSEPPANKCPAPIENKLTANSGDFKGIYRRWTANSCRAGLGRRLSDRFPNHITLKFHLRYKQTMILFPKNPDLSLINLKPDTSSNLTSWSKKSATMPSNTQNEPSSECWLDSNFTLQLAEWKPRPKAQPGPVGLVKMKGLKK